MELSMSKFLAIFVAVHGVALFLVGIPPFDHIASHYFTKYHPVARQMKAVTLISSVTTAQAVGTALDLGIFELLRGGKHFSASNIAHQLELPERGVSPLLETLASADFLYVTTITSQKDNPLYSNSATVEHHLVAGLPPGKDMASVMKMVTSVPFRSTMTRAVQNGGTVLDQHAETHSHPWWEYFAQVTAPLMANSAKEMAHEFSHVFVHPATNHNNNNNNKVRVLDIAAGSGEWGFAVLERHANKVELYQNDYANVLEQTKQNAAKRSGMDARHITYLPGSFWDIHVATNSLDVVLAPNIIHHFSPATTLQFLKRTHSILRPGGTLIIAEICRPEQGYSLLEGHAPMQRTFSLSMLLWSQQGKAYSANEMIELATAAGLEHVQHRGDSFPFTCFITAQKPTTIDEPSSSSSSSE